MAVKRMFSSSVTETDSFLELPLKSQALYFHLGMQGDDDGFVANPRAIIRSIGCTARDLKPLETAGYVISFPSKVLVITDWKANNNLRNDRYKPTAFQNELAQLTESANKRYILASLGIPTGNQMDTIGIPSDNQVTTQHSIAEHSSGRSCKKAATTAARTDSDLAQIVQHFQAEIGEFPRSALDKLQRYREAFSTELICKAIDEAAESGVRKWRYVDALLAQPDLAPYSLPDLDVEHFAPDVQPVFAAVSGFWNSTGTLDAVQICERYPDLKTAVMGCFDEWSAECVRATRPNVEKWTQLVLEQAALTKFQSLAFRQAAA